MSEIVAAMLPNRERLRAAAERLARAGFRWDERLVEQEPGVIRRRRHVGTVLVRVRADDPVRAASARRILLAAGGRMVQPAGQRPVGAAQAAPRRVHVRARVVRRRVMVVRRPRG